MLKNEQVHARIAMQAIDDAPMEEILRPGALRQITEDAETAKMRASLAQA